MNKIENLGKITLMLLFIGTGFVSASEITGTLSSGIQGTSGSIGGTVGSGSTVGGTLGGTTGGSGSTIGGTVVGGGTGSGSGGGGGVVFIQNSSANNQNTGGQVLGASSNPGQVLGVTSAPGFPNTGLPLEATPLPIHLLGLVLTSTALIMYMYRRNKINGKMV